MSGFVRYGELLILEVNGCSQIMGILVSLTVFILSWKWRPLVHFWLYGLQAN